MWIKSLALTDSWLSERLQRLLIYQSVHAIKFYMKICKWDSYKWNSCPISSRGSRRMTTCQFALPFVSGHKMMQLHVVDNHWYWNYDLERKQGCIHKRNSNQRLGSSWKQNLWSSQQEMIARRWSPLSRIFILCFLTLMGWVTMNSSLEDTVWILNSTVLQHLC